MLKQKLRNVFVGLGYGRYEMTKKWKKVEMPEKGLCVEPVFSRAFKCLFCFSLSHMYHERERFFFEFPFIPYIFVNSLLSIILKEMI